MTPSMAFQVVYLGLLNVAVIAYSQICLLDRNIKCQELAEGRLVMQGGKADVLPEILR